LVNVNGNNRSTRTCKSMLRVRKQSHQQQSHVTQCYKPNSKQIHQKHTIATAGCSSQLTPSVSTTRKHCKWPNRNSANQKPRHAEFCRRPSPCHAVENVGGVQRNSDCIDVSKVRVMKSGQTTKAPTPQNKYEVSLALLHCQIITCILILFAAHIVLNHPQKWKVSQQSLLKCNRAPG
jgi:hypothetical protein